VSKIPVSTKKKNSLLRVDKTIEHCRIEADTRDSVERLARISLNE